MKYADGPTTEVEVDVAAPADAVWPYLIDVDLPARFSDEFQGAEWIDDGPDLGARFEGRNRHPVVGEWRVTCTVTAFEPGRIFEWTIGDPEHRSARWRFALEPRGDARSTLRFRAEMGPGPSGLTPAIERMPDREEDIVARRLDEWTGNMQRTVDGIAALAEGRTPTTDHDDR